MCGIGPGDTPNETFMRQWCLLHPEKEYCKNIIDIPECPDDLPWYLCWFYKWWALLLQLVARLLGSLCHFITEEWPWYLQFIAKPICWLTDNPKWGLLAVGLGALFVFLGPLIMDVYIISAK